MIKKSKKLSNEQKDILRKMLNSKEKSMSLDSNSGDTNYLMQKGFIMRPQQIATIDYEDALFFNYVPQSWLMELYQNNSKIKKIIDK